MKTEDVYQKLLDIIDERSLGEISLDVVRLKWMNVLNDFKCEILTNYTDFLLKEGYTDTDVYCEPPTAIDQFLSKEPK